MTTRTEQKLEHFLDQQAAEKRREGMRNMLEGLNEQTRRHDNEYIITNEGLIKKPRGEGR